MAVTITVRSVPDEVRDVLAARAAEAGMSLQEYLSSELRSLASRPNPLEAARIARSHAASMPPLDPDELLTDLDAERR